LGHRLKFDNSYFTYIKEQRDSELLVLETDDVLFKDDGFRWVPFQPLALDKLLSQCYTARQCIPLCMGVEILA